MAKEVVTIVGSRLVVGGPAKFSDKDFGGKPLGVDDKGVPIIEYYQNVAVRKDDPQIHSIIQKMHDVAFAGFPNGEPRAEPFPGRGG